jgi:hypothetical protein
MTTKRVKASNRRGWVIIALGAGIFSSAEACSDTLGLDDLSVATSAGPTSTGSGGAGGAGPACMDCGVTSCVDVLTSCYMDATAGGCQAFLTCAEACGDESCAAGCLAANPAGQLAIDCFCAECAAECTIYCAAAGGSGGTGAAGAGGAGAAGGASSAGGSGGAGGQGD